MDPVELERQKTVQAQSEAILQVTGIPETELVDDDDDDGDEDKDDCQQDEDELARQQASQVGAFAVKTTSSTTSDDILRQKEELLTSSSSSSASSAKCKSKSKGGTKEMSSFKPPSVRKVRTSVMTGDNVMAVKRESAARMKAAPPPPPAEMLLSATASASISASSSGSVSSVDVWTAASEPGRPLCGGSAMLPGTWDVSTQRESTHRRSKARLSREGIGMNPHTNPNNNSDHQPHAQALGHTTSTPGEALFDTNNCSPEESNNHQQQQQQQQTLSPNVYQGNHHKEAQDKDNIPITKRKEFVIMAVVAVLVVGLSLGMGLGFALNKGSKNNNNNNNNNNGGMNDDHSVLYINSTDLSEWEQSLLLEVAPFSVPHDGSSVNHGNGPSGSTTTTTIVPVWYQDPTSPQYMAFQWLANEDIHPHDDGDGGGGDEGTSFSFQWHTRYGLAVLWFATNGNEWSLNYPFMDPNLSECSWYDGNNTGVLCNEQGVVVGLELSNSNLQGTLPEELVAISQLEMFVVNDNPGLAGPLPQFENHQGLVQLKFWEASNCRLNGTALPLPWSSSDSTSMNQLTHLAMAQNQFSFPFSSHLQFLTSLEHVDLSQNHLVGTLPSMPFLTNLKYFNVNQNDLTGTLPRSDFSDLTTLVTMHLYENFFSGSLPPTLGPNLEFFDVGSNRLNGTIPSTWWISNDNNINNDKLSAMRLADNRISGVLPWSNFAKWQSLETLDVGNNDLEGPIFFYAELDQVNDDNNDDGSMVIMPHLATLVLGWNRGLTGTIPTDIGTRFLNPAELQDLILSSCQIHGTLPSELGLLTQLEQLELVSNSLEGTLPPELLNLSSLEMMSLQDNNLEGDSADFLCDLPELVQLSVDCDKIECTCLGKCECA